MDARHATLCFLLVLVLHGNPTAVAGSCSLSLSQNVSDLVQNYEWMKYIVVNFINIFVC